jgi:ubiquinone/menaquinone biosynthesis C-methylase UbiE
MIQKHFLERVTPGKVDSAIWQEHISRYYFALSFVPQKIVLDVACGTGYGSNLLSTKASTVVCVDVSKEALAYAVTQHTNELNNLCFVLADACYLPFRKDVFDVITSFETIEHLEKYTEFLQEIQNILKIGGNFIVSTPNKNANYKVQQSKPLNPYHVIEFDYNEFCQLLRILSRKIDVFGQCPFTIKDRFLAFLSNSLPTFIKRVFRKRTTFNSEVSNSQTKSFDSYYKVRKILNLGLICIPRYILIVIKKQESD